jgi:hypothetical protein
LFSWAWLLKDILGFNEHGLVLLKEFEPAHYKFSSKPKEEEDDSH